MIFIFVCIVFEQIGNRLTELTKLAADHVAQQTDVVARFTNRITPLFEQNAQIYESSLYLFDEKLTEVKKKLLRDVAYFIPELIVVDHMEHVSRLREYHTLLKRFCRILFAFEEYVQWINKEETLLKVERSEYADICVIREYLVPFTVLIK